MQTCPQCNATNRDEAKFCASCGAPLEAPQSPEPVEGPPAQAEARPLCPSCGAENEADAKFCEACGAALQQAPAPPAETEPTSEPAPSPVEAPEEIPTPLTQPPAPAEPTTLTCPACGAEHESDAKFCGSCGAGLQQATAPPAEAKPAPEPVPSPAEPPEQPPAPPAQPPAEPPSTAEPTPIAAVTETAQCPSCGYVVHYCPSCSAPMQPAAAGPSDQSGVTPQQQATDTQ